MGFSAGRARRRLRSGRRSSRIRRLANENALPRGHSHDHRFHLPRTGLPGRSAGKALADAYPTAAHVFAEVDDALGQKLSTLMWEGPENELTTGERPAGADGRLARRHARARGEGRLGQGDAAFVAGHLLGEYSALAAAGSLSITTPRAF